jgi:outer membrane murein-binding lipoprotein Lpp
MNNMIKMGAAALCVVFAAGCADLKPLQAEVDALKTQVAKLQSDADGLKSGVSSASSAASSAQQSAQAASSKADQALSAAQASQQCCDTTNEKIDRVFKKSMSK